MDPKILVGDAYEDSWVLQKPISIDKQIANRAVGGTTNWSKLTEHQRAHNRPMFGPGSSSKIGSLPGGTRINSNLNDSHRKIKK